MSATGRPLLDIGLPQRLQERSVACYLRPTTSCDLNYVVCPSSKRASRAAFFGPTCGIVALSMLINGEVTPEEILNIAKLEGYTNNGEMFSVKNMKNLAEKVLSLADIDNINYEVKNGYLYSVEMVENLLNGAMIMVPYDPDVNHMPTLRKGHTAHWALICGVIIVNKPSEPTTIKDDNIYVLCRHGKSKYITAWDLAKLAASNNNLWEFSPKKQDDGLIYIMPEGGMGGENGLRGQYLTFMWK